VNHKRVERLYVLAGLQVRRRKRKKVPLTERQPLVANTVWSMDFVFDRSAEGRVIKCLTIHRRRRYARSHCGDLGASHQR